MALQGIMFDNFDTYRDWGFYLVSSAVSAPAPKVYKVDVPGGNGSIDVTEAVLGSVAYNDRTITCVLRKQGVDILDWPNLFSDMQAAILGKKMQIIIPDDPGYYYIGRPVISSCYRNNDRAEMTIECDCEPFKYLINAYGADWLWDPFDFLYGEILDDTKTITGTTAVTLETLKMPVTPSFRASKAMTVTYSGKTYTIPANKDIKFYELVLTEGTHVLTFKVSGTGTVKIKFTNGIL